jgi:hypothetical protein
LNTLELLVNATCIRFEMMMASEGNFAISLTDSELEENWHEFLSNQGDYFNATIRQLGGTDYQVYDSDALCGVLDSLNSDDFWDDMISANNQANLARQTKLVPQKPVSRPSKRTTALKAATGLEAVVECSDSYERLYEGQEKLMEFMNDSHPIDLDVPESQQDMTPIFDNVMKFTDSDVFWNEIVGMEAEVGAQAKQQANRDLADIGLDAIIACGDAQQTLSDAVHEIISDCRDSQEPEQPDLLQSKTSTIEQEDVDKPVSEVSDILDQIVRNEEDSSFYPDILAMEEEKNEMNGVSTTGLRRRNLLPTVDVEELLASAPSVTPSINAATPPPAKGESLLTTTTIWDDMKVLKLDPQKQVYIEKNTIVDNPIISSMAEEIETRSLKGPNVKYSFLILMVAALSIALISYSHSVRESPILFRILWVLAYMINFITVSIPGRLDRVVVDGNHIKPWTSLFEASPWAFAIWGLIYFAEVGLSGYVSIIGIPIKLFQKLVPYWLAGNWCQGLWCFAFRPEFKASLWVPTVFLLLGTLTFTKLHWETTLFMRASYGKEFNAANIGMMVFRTPMGMHAAWLAAATLLNFNSYVAVSRCSKGQQIAVAHASIYIATAFGMYFAWATNDATISLTAAWALESVAHRTFEKIKAPGNVVGADVQESLAISESVLCNGLKCISLGIIMAPFVTNQ